MCCSNNENIDIIKIPNEGSIITQNIFSISERFGLCMINNDQVVPYRLKKHQQRLVRIYIFKSCFFQNMSKENLKY